MNLDGVALYPQIRMLNNVLSGGRIDKICQPNKYDVYCYIRQPGVSYTLFISVDPQRPLISITKDNPDNPPEPPTFCMLLRKQIEGGRIASIEQYGLDRILTIDIDTIGSKGILCTKTLIVELVGKYSNIILMEDGRIIDALRRIGENNNRVRTVLPGYEYQLPPIVDSFNMMTTNTEVLFNTIKNTTGTLYQVLLKILQGSGPITIKEIIYRSKLNTDILVENLKNDEITILINEINTIAQQLKNNNLNPSLIIEEKSNKVKALAPFVINTYEDNYSLKHFTDYNSLIEYYKNLVYVINIPNQLQYQRLIKNEINRLRKKIKILSQELVNAEKADMYRIKADTLMTYQYQIIDSYAKKITLPNIYSLSNEMLNIDLDPRYSLMDNIQQYYKKYEKLKRSKHMINKQIILAQEDLKYAESIDIAINNCQSITDLEDIKQEMIKAHFLPKPKKKGMSIAKSKPWRFTLPNGMDVLVGKNNLQNDIISFKMAKNDDIWMHTKDIPGSHLIIITNGEKIDDYNLGLAAQIAIYFSKGRDSTNVQVDYLLRKYLKKPSGAKPGYTIFTNNKTIYATVDEEQIYPIINK